MDRGTGFQWIRVQGLFVQGRSCVVSYKYWCLFWYWSLLCLSKRVGEDINVCTETMINRGTRIFRGVFFFFFSRFSCKHFSFYLTRFGVVVFFVFFFVIQGFWFLPIGPLLIVDESIKSPFFLFRSSNLMKTGHIAVVTEVEWSL